MISKVTNRENEKNAVNAGGGGDTFKNISFASLEKDQTKKAETLNQVVELASAADGPLKFSENSAPVKRRVGYGIY